MSPSIRLYESGYLSDPDRVATRLHERLVSPTPEDERAAIRAALEGL